MGSEIRIRLAEASDLPAVAGLATETFIETYAKDNDPDDIGTYVEATFSQARLRAELDDQSTRLLLAETDHGLVAYAQLAVGSGADGLSAVAPAELARIYVRSSHHGRGLGRLLLDACLDQARAAGCDVLWLGVWERNMNAIAFYERMGFEHFGSHRFRLGSQAQTDLLMSLSLSR